MQLFDIIILKLLHGKEQVLNRFGEPQSRRAAVGDPPISRWNYSGYSVYFEYNIVLHSLVHRQ